MDNVKSTKQFYWPFFLFDTAELNKMFSTVLYPAARSPAYEMKVPKPTDFLEDYRLVHSSSNEKGYSRLEKEGGFEYLDTFGKPIASEKVLKRIRALVLPPAWTDVWICAKANGHLQATGIDTKGRKQYKYHPLWQKIRNETKFDQLYYFGKNLKKLRRQIEKDLRKRTLCKEKVTALALSIMEQTLIRVGNAEYEKEYGSHGLTTLKNRHLRFQKGHALFRFKGKKGVLHRIDLPGSRLIRLLKKVKELPGQELFQYINDENASESLNSHDINDYLKKHMGGDFTCKDFRTWAGCISAIECMLEYEHDCTTSKSQIQKSLVAVIDQVAERLGNTRAVCKKYYIHPQLLRLFEDRQLRKRLSFSASGTIEPTAIEKAFISFLRKEIKAKERVLNKKKEDRS